ncbi:MAG: hypothetical protein ACRCYZ_03625 [Alphaproteobacteria bacterium]
MSNVQMRDSQILAQSVTKNYTKESTKDLISRFKKGQEESAESIVEAVRLGVCVLVEKGSNQTINNILSVSNSDTRRLIQKLIQKVTVYQLVSPVSDVLKAAKETLKTIKGKKESTAEEIAAAELELFNAQNANDDHGLLLVGGKAKAELKVKRKVKKDKDTGVETETMTENGVKTQAGADKNFIAFMEKFEGNILLWGEFNHLTEKRETARETKQAEIAAVKAERKDWSPRQLHTAHIEKVEKAVNRLIKDNAEDGIPKDLAEEITKAIQATVSGYHDNIENATKARLAAEALAAEIAEYGARDADHLAEIKAEKQAEIARENAERRAAAAAAIEAAAQGEQEQEAA